jgi:hypothetical protein
MMTAFLVVLTLCFVVPYVAVMYPRTQWWMLALLIGVAMYLD